ncbi:BTB/POZ fold domain-containing protein [Strongyloides ratti]|uniref:BTB/POZ fold domain-containing protein n=1 Tax=Strongyloides ratti TaxID=34506 RepID=A0A090LQS7_STRRB|nr:BTB/POZ fold domain-containing protein [Strongyloides ratti]CEF70531.1 BTB/POZ fold domain-containing protein [Strongyloides ratti]
MTSYSVGTSITPKNIHIKYMNLIDVLDNITKKGHSLTDQELEEAEVLLSALDLSKTFYNYGRGEFLHYITLYNLKEEDAFKFNNLEAKSDFIKLIFPDGSCVVRNEFLLKYFHFFKDISLNALVSNKSQFVIVGFSIHHFCTILKFFYANTIYLNHENIFELYRICDIFKVEASFKQKVICYINHFYVSLSKTIGFYKYHIYLEEGHLGGSGNRFKINNDDEFDDISRLLYLYQWKYNGGIGFGR